MVEALIDFEEDEDLGGGVWEHGGLKFTFLLNTELRLIDYSPTIGLRAPGKNS